MFWSCYAFQVLLGTPSLKFQILILLNCFRCFQEQLTQLFSKEQHRFLFNKNTHSTQQILQVPQTATSFLTVNWLLSLRTVFPVTKLFTYYYLKVCMLLEDVFTRILLVKQPGDGLQGTQPASNRNGPELNLCFYIKQKSSRNVSGFQVLAVEILAQPRANSCFLKL